MMLFITIPIALVVLALVGIAVVVGRKVQYLKKLTPAVGEQPTSWWYEMFHEFVDWYRSIHFRQHREAFFREVEKFLRKVRLVFSQIDRFSASLINRARRAHVESSLASDEQAAAAQQPVAAPVPAPAPVKTPTQAERLKQREQDLIIAIAKDPKSPALYEELGDVYLKMKNFGDAKESFEAALEFKPDDVALTEKLARARAGLPADTQES